MEVKASQVSKIQFDNFMIKNFHPTYRPDIDGLRAIAILSVIIYHAFPDAIPGGFVGVDIFFVISGFLISSIIFKSLEASNFSYLDFYSRRIKRIFPALIIVLIGVLVAGWFVLRPDEFELLGKSVLAGGAFVSNIISWREVGYFNSAAQIKPLLHLWSLGVEEQYYIIWPILVVFIWKRSHNFILIVLPILIGSFLLNIYAINIKPDATFYLPITRFWELMIGSLLAFTTLHKINFFDRRIPHNIISILGLFLLIVSFVWIDGKKSFPGYWAVIPTGGAFFVILAGKDAFINSKILSNRVAVFIGLISYPLYLWHWPLLAYSKVVGMTSVYHQMLMLSLSFILAYFTYVFIEKPLRIGSRNVPASLIFVMLVVTTFGALIFNGCIQPLHSTAEIKRISRAIGEWTYPGQMKPFMFNNRTFYRIYNNKLAQDKSDEIVFFGDSNMEQYYPNIDELSSKSNKSIIFITQGGCIPIPGVLEDKHKECIGLAEDFIAYASKSEVKTIVISAYWYGYFDKHSTNYFFENKGNQKLFLGKSNGKRVAMKSLETLLLRLNKMGKKIYLVLNIPRGDALGPQAMINQSLVSDLPFFSIKYGSVSRSSFVEYESIDTALIEISRTTKALIIDPKIFLCVKKECSSVSENGEPIYKDASHLRPSFVRTQIHFLDETIN